MTVQAASRVVTWPDPILERACEPVPDSAFCGDELRELSQLLHATLDEYGGLGLAAPQIGRSIRVFVHRDYPGAFCNPIVERVIDETEVVAEEGCLSLPGIRLKVPRAKRIKVKWWSLEGLWRGDRLRDIDARTFLHELDHLDGICIPQRSVD